MITFQRAKQVSRAVDLASREDPGAAAQIWAGVQGDKAPAGSFAEALGETTPGELAPLVSTNATAAGYAFSKAWPERAVAAGKTGFELRDLARSVWAQVQQRADAANDIEEGFGSGGEEAWETERQVAESKTNLDLVRRIARLAGRMYAALRGSPERMAAPVPEEIHGIEVGGEIQRVLPAEQTLLTDPDLELVFLEKFAERKLLQYELRGTEEVGRGPLVIALDESGSMHGRRNEWAKAVAVAATRVAHDDKRPVSIVHWSTAISVDELPNKDAAKLVKSSLHFFSGDNDVGRAMAESVRQVEKFSKKGQRGADVILVTDGIEPSTPRLVQALKDLEKTGAKLHLIAIEVEIQPDFPTRKAASNYTRVGGSDLSNDHSILGLAGALKP